MLMNIPKTLAFNEPDEILRFKKVMFKVAHLGDMTLDLTTDQPGWAWSAHHYAHNSLVPTTMRATG